MQQLHFPPAQGSSNRPDLPPLVIPVTTEGSPNPMSSTHDAPLTIDDDEIPFGEGSDNEDEQGGPVALPYHLA
jgi:hypothetical protein